jgi:hypothetical protein
MTWYCSKCGASLGDTVWVTLCGDCRIIESNEASRANRCDSYRPTEADVAYYRDMFEEPSFIKRTYRRLVYLSITLGLVWVSMALPMIVGIIPLLFALCSFMFVLL